MHLQWVHDLTEGELPRTGRFDLSIALAALRYPCIRHSNKPLCNASVGPQTAWLVHSKRGDATKTVLRSVESMLIFVGVQP